ncbi:DUF4277 domain-containing protein [Microcystis aeruginosa BLCCF158]|uniref:DUF4277 domain-containing protein n=1 Tax=Microcystis aeruginosa BLCC-F158 TaxID=2755316 RepID=A0A841V8I2_MICAE|nr:DUF4277 domain-containing protein [Microcystis aeruginosa BLCC-F158]
MNANCASYPKVSLGLGFKNPTREDSYLKSATPYLFPQFFEDKATEHLLGEGIEPKQVNDDIAFFSLLR